MMAQTNTPTLGYGDYLRFSRLLQERCGLHFPEKRRGDLEQGLRQAFAASTCSDLNTYYQTLLDPDRGRVYFQYLVNVLTIGESHFFRNAGQFDALYHHVLPGIIERRRSLRTLRIWSAGCSSGEEPYSIAMTLRELLPDVDDWAITVMGTDINTEALKRAREAEYGDWAFREDRAKLMRRRYFRRQGKRYQLLPEVRRMVTFRQLNLAVGDYPSFKTNTTFLDLILCRNVTIYFSPTVTNSVVDRFYDCLVDEGWLVIGHAEHSLVTYRRFQAQSYPHAILYQRTGKPTVLPDDWDWLTPVPNKAGVPSLRVPSANQARDQKDVSPSLLPQPEPADPISDTLEKVQELLDYGHSGEAYDRLVELQETHPHHPAGASLLCQACANLGVWEEAEQWCRKAVRLNNLDTQAYYTLALLMQHQNRLGEAVKAMKKVLYLDRNSVLGHYGLADLYHSQRRLPEALKALDNAHRLLDEMEDNTVIPHSGGITVSNLRPR